MGVNSVVPMSKAPTTRAISESVQFVLNCGDTVMSKRGKGIANGSPWQASIVTDDPKLFCHEQFVSFHDFFDNLTGLIKTEIRKGGPCQALSFDVKTMPGV